MRITRSTIIRLAGLAAMIAGLLYMAIQIAHPANIPAQVNTTRWAIAHNMTVAFAFFAILGITGIYARQVEESGWLGFIGYLLFLVALSIIMSYTFFEAYILPSLVDVSTSFVEEVFTIFDGGSGPGALGTVYALSGVSYLLGGALFGIGLFRANVLPRWASIVFTVGIVGSLLGAISETLARGTTFIVGAGLIGLGYALFTEHRKSSQTTFQAIKEPQTS